MPSPNVVPGMRDFFGKKLGGFVSQFFGHLSPVGLARESGAAKAGTATLTSDVGTWMGGVRDAIRNRNGYGMRDWFGGFNLGESRAGLADSLRRSRQIARWGTVGAIGGVLTGSIAPGNPLDVVGRSALTAGAHVGITAAIGRSYPGLAGAYAAWGGFNMLRRGNQIGPY